MTLCMWLREPVLRQALVAEAAVDVLSRKHVEPEVRPLVDFLAERFEKKRWPD